MAEHIINGNSKRSQTQTTANESIVESAWPGGLTAMLEQYVDQKTTPGAISRVTGLKYRSIVRILHKHNIAPFDTKTACQIARRLNPEWNENISRAKIRTPFRHTPEVTREAQRKRSELFLEHPERRGMIYVGKTEREQAFSDMLSRCGIAHKFNQPADKYWLDFLMTELKIGVEVQRSQRIPDQHRDHVICEKLQLRTIIYVPNFYFKTINTQYIESLLKTITIDHESLAPAIGDARFLCTKLENDCAVWYGFRFKHRWDTSATPRPPVEPTGEPARSPAQVA